MFKDFDWPTFIAGIVIGSVAGVFVGVLLWENIPYGVFTGLGMGLLIGFIMAVMNGMEKKRGR